MKSESKIELGSRIKAAREFAGLTQEKLAASIDKSIQYMSALERGNNAPSLETLIAISKELGVSCDYLLLGYDDSLDPTLVDRIKFLSAENKDLLNQHITLMLDWQKKQSADN